MPPDASHPERISTVEAARLAGYTVGYISRLCRQGRLPATRTPSGWTILKTDLDAYLRAVEEEKARLRESLSKQREAEYKASTPRPTLERLFRPAAPMFAGVATLTLVIFSTGAFMVAASNQELAGVGTPQLAAVGSASSPFDRFLQGFFSLFGTHTTTITVLPFESAAVHPATSLPSPTLTLGATPNAAGAIASTHEALTTVIEGVSQKYLESYVSSYVTDALAGITRNIAGSVLDGQYVHPSPSIGPSGSQQTGANITLTSIASTTNGLTSDLTITATNNSIQFAPSLSGTLTLAGGGTGTSTWYSGGVVFSDGTELTQASNAGSNSFYWDNVNSRLGIGTTTPDVAFQVGGTGAIGLPYGTSAERPAGVTGLIRFNTTTKGFEGYNGSVWSGLGGVIDVNQDTYILAESAPGANEDTLFFTTDGTEKMRITPDGKVGIGTTSPSATLAVNGDGYISGSLTVGDNLTIQNGSISLGSATSTLTLNGYVGSSIIPAINKSYDLGSPSLFWRNAYVDSLTVNTLGAASTTISGTASNSFTINSDNATSDTEDMSLIFFRGIVNPNAVLSWNSTLDRFEFNQPGLFWNQSSTTTIPSLIARAATSQTADIFEAQDSNSNVLTNITNAGFIGIGTTTPASQIEIKSSTNDARFTAGSATYYRQNGNLRFSGFGLGAINFGGSDDNFNTVKVGASINSRSQGTGANFYSQGATPSPVSDLFFQTTSNGASAPLPRVWIDSTGYVGVGDFNDGQDTSTGILPTNQLQVRIGSQSTAKTADFSTLFLDNSATSTTSNLIKSGVRISSTGNWNGTGASNIGLYVASVTGGTNNYDAIFNGGGNVGIGTTSPGTRLDVYSSTANTVIRANNNAAGFFERFTALGENANSYVALTHNNSGTGNTNLLDIPFSANIQTGSSDTGGLVFDTQAAAPIIFGTNGSGTNKERVRIDGAGNVGIGTSSPMSKLSISGLGGGTQYLNYGGTGTGYSNTSGGVLELSDYFGTNPWGIFTDNGGKFNIQRKNDTLPELTIIGATGAVGIGTTSPSTNLQIYKSNGGALASLDVDPSNTAWFDFRVGNVERGFLQYNVADSLSGVGTAMALVNTQGKLHLFDSTNSGLTVSGGNVGVATTSPQFKLDVAGKINVDSYDGYYQNGSLLAYASTTNQSVSFGVNISSAINSASTFLGATAVGSQALANLSSGVRNTAIGRQALFSLQSGNDNVAVGVAAGNLTGSDNIALGTSALGNVTNSNQNIAIGSGVFQGVSAATNSIAIGYRAGGIFGSRTIVGDTILGASAGSQVASDYNTFIGYQSGTSVTSGYGNVLLGANADSTQNITTGGNNIGIGYDLFFPSATASNQLNIGNFVFGTLPATTTSSSVALNPTGAKLGIASSSPYATLSIHANNGSTNTTLFAVGSSTANATTTLFSILNSGNIGINTAAPAFPLDVAGKINTDQYSGYYQNGSLLAYGSTTNHSVIFGQSAAPVVTTNSSISFNTTAIGYQALTSLTSSAQFNTAVGSGAGSSLTSGSNNAIFGFDALSDTTDGADNIAIGNNALGGTTFPNHPQQNVAIGSAVLQRNNNGTGDVGVGYNALAILNANYNTALGYKAGSLHTAGDYNIEIGQNVSFPDTSPSQQLDIGNILYGTGLYNGSTATSVPTVNGKIGIGTSAPAFTLDVAGKINTDQYSGFYQNGSLLAYASSTNGATLFGIGAGGQNATTSASLRALTAIGYQALSANTTGSFGTALGYTALQNNTTGQANIGIGYEAAKANTTGQWNIGIGWDSLLVNQTTSNNIGIGNFTFNNLNQGTGANIAIGVNALANGSKYSGVIGIGNTALNNISTATNTIAIGAGAGDGNGLSYSAQGNILIGNAAGSRSSTGADYNILLGYQAGRNILASAGNIIIGSNVDIPNSAANNQLDIGNVLYGTGIYSGSGNSPVVSGTPVAGGKIGIGTSSPAYTLDVAGAINTDQYSGYYQNGSLLGYASSTNQSTIFGLGAGGQNATTSASVASTIAIGYQALNSLTTGTNNVAIGANTLSLSKTNFRNIALGSSALQNLAGSGNNDNIGIGTSALGGLTSGFENIVIGSPNAASNFTTGSDNVLIGERVAQSITNSNFNTAFGAGALNGGASLATNQGNTAAGYLAGGAQGGADFNIFFGYESGWSNTTGYGNTIIGSNPAVVRTVTTGGNNIAIGVNTILPSLTGNNQLDIGNFIYGQMPATTTASTFTLPTSGALGIASSSPYATLSVQAVNGSTNTTLFAIGSSTASATTTLFSILNSGNVGIGTATPAFPLDVSGKINTDKFSGYYQDSQLLGYASSTNHDTIFGFQAGGQNATTSATALGITAIGFQALTAAGAANQATAVGYQALMNVTTGQGNVGVGYQAGKNITGTGQNNLLFGSTAGLGVTTGTDNVAIGNAALNGGGTTGAAQQNVAIGSNALFSASSVSVNQDVAIGYQSLQSLTIGSDDIAIGRSALSGISSTNRVIALGTQTGELLSGGGSDILIGAYVQATSTTASNSLNIANTLFGSGIYGGSSDSSSPVINAKLGIASSSPSSEFVIHAVNGSSNANLFTIGSSTASATTTLFNVSNQGLLQFGGYGAGTLQTDSSGNVTVSSDQRLKNVYATFDRGLSAIEGLQPELFHWNDISGLNQNDVNAGFIAQNVQQYIPEAVGQDSRGYLTLQDRPILAAAVNAIKDLANQATTLSNATTTLSTRVDTLNAAITTRQALVATTVSADTITTTAISSNAFTAPASQLSFVFGTTTIATQAPSEALTAGGNVDLFKLASYTLARTQYLALSLDTLTNRVNDIDTRLSALEAAQLTLASSTATSTPATSGSLADMFQSFGAVIQNGLAQFQTLVARQFVASKDADGTSSAGEGTILAGKTEVAISNKLVHPSSKIFITFTGPVDGWYVSQKTEGSFTVTLKSSTANDVSFDYFIVQTEVPSASNTASASSATGDTVPPVITLSGSDPLYVPVGGTYTDPGVTAVDAVDGPVSYTIQVNGKTVGTTVSLDTSAPATYTLTYVAFDKTGNSSQATRTVIVANPGDTGASSGSTSTASTTSGSSTSSTDTSSASGSSTPSAGSSAPASSSTTASSDASSPSGSSGTSAPAPTTP